MPELHGAAAIGVAGVVAAGVVHVVGVGTAVRLGARQDVMLIRHVADAIHDCLLLRQRELFA
jgi:hypothetical protein